MIVKHVSSSQFFGGGAGNKYLDWPAKAASACRCFALLCGMRPAWSISSSAAAGLTSSVLAWHTKRQGGVGMRRNS